MEKVEIDSLDDKRLEEFTKLKASTLLRNDSIVIESYKVIHKAIHNHIKIKKLLTTKELWNEFEKEFSEYLEDQDFPIFLLPQNLINSIVGQSFHGGMMAICERPHRGINFKEGLPILVLNGLTSPENVGAIIRSATGFNIFNILLDKKSCHPHIKRAIRVSMGNVFFCHIHEAESLEVTLKELKDEGYDVLSLANLESAKPIREYAFKKKSCLIVGSEGHGVDQNILELSTDIIKIPMNEEVMHFNAACASSIALYEFSSKLTMS